MLRLHVTIYYYNKALLDNISLEHLLLVQTSLHFLWAVFIYQSRPARLSLLVKGVCVFVRGQSFIELSQHVI